MTTALIIYASWTGTTFRIAKLLAEALQKLEVDAKVKECTEAYPSEFMTVDLCVVATYTYGSDGALPEEAEDFFYDLEAVNLQGKVYGVLGSGDRIYKKYCPAVDDFDTQFQKTGAMRGANVLKINLQPDKDDIAGIRKFAEDLVDAFTKKSN